MFIDGLGSVKFGKQEPIKKKIASKDFHSLIQEESVSNLDSIFETATIENVVDNYDKESEAKQKSKAVGKKLIEYMENIRDNLANGKMNMADIYELEQIAKKSRENFFDPKLSEILDEIELRAAVEIAKSEKLKELT